MPATGETSACFTHPRSCYTRQRHWREHQRSESPDKQAELPCKTTTSPNHNCAYACPRFLDFLFSLPVPCTSLSNAPHSSFETYSVIARLPCPAALGCQGGPSLLAHPSQYVSRPTQGTPDMASCGKNSSQIDEVSCECLKLQA